MNVVERLIVDSLIVVGQSLLPSSLFFLSPLIPKWIPSFAFRTATHLDDKDRNLKLERKLKKKTKTRTERDKTKEKSKC
jgi:hypothetical protein